MKQNPGQLNIPAALEDAAVEIFLLSKTPLSHKQSIAIEIIFAASVELRSSGVINFGFCPRL